MRNRYTRHEAMLAMIKMMRKSMMSLTGSVERLRQQPVTRSEDERRRDQGLREQHSKSRKRVHSLSEDHSKINKGRKRRRSNESESGSGSSSSSESDSEQKQDSSNGDDAEGLLRPKTSTDAP